MAISKSKFQMSKSKSQANYRLQKPKHDTLCLCHFDLGLDLAFGLCHLSFPFIGVFVLGLQDFLLSDLG